MDYRRGYRYSKRMLSQEKISGFRNLMYDHYREHSRDFPWRETRDPYAIWVSETMLQQTQTIRVMSKYPQFMKAFPTMERLAAAPLEHVLLLWQGLGYNRRALSLHRSAKILCAELKGEVPNDMVLLGALPGVGPYTAAAIRTFAYGEPEVFIETNIRRVYIHHFFPDQARVTDKELIPFIQETLNEDDPRVWYYALMDYGADLSNSVANPNRRSAQYARQSAFSGSDRQMRGLALKYLLHNGSATVAKFARYAHLTPTKSQDILESLYRDGFLICEKKTYKLADGSSYSKDY